MRKKQFKAESKKLLDMMINSVYTNKDIFLRELISNASDAIDKLYFKSLTDQNVGMNKEDFFIKIDLDKEKRTIKITDNGIGMTAEELEKDLGTIAKSGSYDFKNGEDQQKNEMEIIGQFGVGFYSAFMVADKVTVLSKAYGSDEANLWTSEGADGYTVEPAEKDSCGTVITLYLKEDTETDKYSDYLETYRIENIIRKYSDYISFPIKMDVEKQVPVEKDEKSDEEKQESENSDESKDKEPEYKTVVEKETINSMVPIWRKNKNELTDEDYNNFYHEKFYDYENPLKTIHFKTEGIAATFDSLLFIPSHPQYDYYTKNFEKGLQLYSNGVLIMDKCKEMLPDYFSFVRGLVDSSDLSLNLSRETLQQNHQVKVIANAIEKKIKNELASMLENDRETYEKFWKSFGMQIKYGLYESYGMNKDKLQDLVLFTSSNEKKLTTFKEYVSRMKEGQKDIYYACGETVAKAEALPQTQKVLDKGYEILYLTDNIDEFALQMIRDYDSKQFKNVASDSLDLETDEEKEALKKKNEDSKDLLDKMKGFLDGKVSEVRFTDSLAKYPACLTSKGMISSEMEKVLNQMPDSEKVKADTVLEINESHPVAEKLSSLDDDKLKEYTELLYMQARLIGGLQIEDPAKFSELISSLM